LLEKISAWKIVMTASYWFN